MKLTFSNYSDTKGLALKTSALLFPFNDDQIFQTRIDFNSMLNLLNNSLQYIVFLKNYSTSNEKYEIQVSLSYSPLNYLD